LLITTTLPPQTPHFTNPERRCRGRGRSQNGRFTPLRPGIAVQRLPAILYALPEFVLDDAQFRQVLDDLRAVRI